MLSNLLRPQPPFCRKPPFLAGLVSLLCCIGIAFSQAPTRTYSLSDGLPANNIISSYEDSKGFCWISTVNGLSRFDGRQFVNYGYQHGLGNLVVHLVYEDRKNRLWVGTRDGLWQKKGERFVQVNADLPPRFTHIFQVMETRKGDVWVLTNKGIFALDDAGTTMHRLALYPGMDTLSCRQVLDRPDGMLVNYGLLLLRRTPNGQWQELGRHPSSDFYFNMLMEYRGEPYVNTPKGIEWVGPNGLVLKALNKRPGNPLDRFTIDSRNRLWYMEYEDRGNAYLSVPGNWSLMARPLHLGNALVNTIRADLQGNVWLSTSEGLMRYTLNDIGAIRPVSGSISGAVLPEGGMLVLTSEGFYQLPRDSLRVSAGRMLLSHAADVIDFSAPGNDGELWLVTRFGWLWHYRAGHLQKMANVKQAEPEGYVSMFRFDSRRRRLLFTVEGRLWSYQETAGFQRLLVGGKGLPGPGCLRLVVRANGDVLTLQEGRGLCRLTMADSLVTLLADTACRVDDRLAMGNDSLLWMSSLRFGLRAYALHSDGSLALQATVSGQQGLMDPMVYSMAADSIGQLWVNTARGLDVVLASESGTWTVRNFSNHTNLYAENMAFASLACDATGAIWLLAYKGLLRIDPATAIIEDHPPNVVIDRVQLNHETVNWQQYADSLEGHAALPNHPVIPYQLNTLTFTLAAITNSFVPRVQFTYRLLPLDEHWIGPTDAAEINFARLAPGRYTLEAKAREAGGHWGRAAVFPFLIRTPFYRSAWFLSLAALLLLGLLYGLYTYRVSELKKLLHLRAHISRDLHDEIGSTLTSISILSHLALRNLPATEEKQRSLVQRIADQASAMQQTMSDIIWSILPDNDHSANLLLRMRETLAQLADQQGWQVHWEAAEDALPESLPMAQRRNMYLIFREAVNNAVKHSGGNRLVVVLQRDHGSLHLRITDNGKGFEEREVKAGNGLRNLQARAATLKGQLRIYRSQEGGTTVELVCPAT